MGWLEAGLGVEVDAELEVGWQGLVVVLEAGVEVGAERGWQRVVELGEVWVHYVWVEVVEYVVLCGVPGEGTVWETFV